tara:strand:- start:436 stop:855 length:420 start_codon:yes stop_codon:yes gene_type:complete
MTSLTEQMEQLQKQQAILTEKIKEEEKRKIKLEQSSSIDRLEALIEPITKYLDWVQTSPNSFDIAVSRRDFINNRYEREKEQTILKNHGKSPPYLRNIPIKYNYDTVLPNEEIFVTLLGVIKKQDSRIQELEKLCTLFS